MTVYVECICGKKYEIDRSQVEQFDCAGCGRSLHVPDEKLEQKLLQIRARMKEGEPGMRDAMNQAAALRNFHAVPLLKEGAASGMRESVNIALTAMVDFPGPGREVILEWVKSGALSMSRLVSALREQKYEAGGDYISELIETGTLKENQIAEVAPYLGDSNSLRALEVLRAARERFPNLGGLLDDAMMRMKHLDENAGAIPESAKRIPGREAPDADAPAKKGCLGLLLALLPLVGMLAAVVMWVTR
ncbi:MAG: hypothetical protein H6841_02620 [Planctomycetes bacterium]|nr:hypothetical protein [Planctomycetota bacterium]MCB9936356.1 hypothetical protein [Planctomycetota bacterium]